MTKRVEHKFIGVYRDYNVYGNGKTFYVSGRHARISQLFHSRKNAEKRIDWLIKVNENCPCGCKPK